MEGYFNFIEGLRKRRGRPKTMWMKVGKEDSKA